MSPPPPLSPHTAGSGLLHADKFFSLKAVLRIKIRIRIRRIRMFLGLLDPDLLVRGMDPDPDPDHQAKIVRKILIPTVL